MIRFDDFGTRTRPAEESGELADARRFKLDRLRAAGVTVADDAPHDRLDAMVHALANGYRVDCIDGRCGATRVVRFDGGGNHEPEGVCGCGCTPRSDDMGKKHDLFGDTVKRNDAFREGFEAGHGFEWRRDDVIDEFMQRNLEKPPQGRTIDPAQDESFGANNPNTERMLEHLREGNGPRTTIGGDEWQELFAARGR